MVVPLAKKYEATGCPYLRRPEVEQEIEALLKEPPAVWKQRAAIGSPKLSGYLSSECLTYLFREAERRQETAVRDQILSCLLERCSRILENKISDGLRHAEDLRHEILTDFVELCLTEHPPGGNLDYYEVNFNAAFKRLRAGKIRTALVKNGREAPLSEIEGFNEETPCDDIYAALTKAAYIASEQEIALMRKRVWEAINQLPPEERDAVALKMAGYQIESKDPRVPTISSKCKCDPRTVRNRLDRAHAKLAEALKEEKP